MKAVLVVALLVFPALAHSQSMTHETLNASGPLKSGSVVRIPVRADSRLWLEGSSNVRDWTCKATSMEASVAIEGLGSNAKKETGRPTVRDVSVRVPVRMLKCGDRHMEAEMYAALKSPDNSPPAYILAEFGRLPDAVASGMVVETDGFLTLAGVQRAVRMSVSSDVLPDGTRRARGTVPILMTDFGIKPPRPWGGILRTSNKVLVQFEIFISPPA